VLSERLRLPQGLSKGGTHFCYHAPQDLFHRSSKQFGGSRKERNPLINFACPEALFLCSGCVGDVKHESSRLENPVHDIHG